MAIDGPTVPPARRRAGYAILAVVLAGLVGIAGTVVATLPSGPSKPPMSVVGGPFRLQPSKGGIVDSATLSGRPFLVSFGFARCPNVCPTTLADLIDALHARGGDIRAYDVTRDPERDTVEVPRDDMTSVGDAITGLTGTPEAIARAARAYRVSVQRGPLPGGDGTFGHTPVVYLMDGTGASVGPLDRAAGHDLALRQIAALR